MREKMTTFDDYRRGDSREIFWGQSISQPKVNQDCPCLGIDTKTPQRLSQCFRKTARKIFADTKAQLGGTRWCEDLMIGTNEKDCFPVSRKERRSKQWRHVLLKSLSNDFWEFIKQILCVPVISPNW